MKLPLPVPPILVAGLARAGTAAVELLLDRYGSSGVLAWDAGTSVPLQQEASRLRSMGVEALLGVRPDDAIARLGARGSIVKSPGVPMTAGIVELAKARDLDCIDELELGWRAARVPIVAVTGTNGKSTTCALLAGLHRQSGRNCQIVGNTEFGPPLSGADPAAEVLVCEVSSFQLEASPTFRPDVAVLTNLTAEHLDRHGDMATYGAVKRRLFINGRGELARTSVVNIDDEFGRALARDLREAGGRVISYGEASGADVQINSCDWDIESALVSLATPKGRITLQTKLPGDHNAHNVAAAVAAGIAGGMPLEVIQSAIERVASPLGRWDVVARGRPCDVIVDFAHTPDGLQQVLKAAKAVTTRRKSRLIVVFGPVGLADPAKAVGCAAAIARFADIAIVTTGSAPRSARIPRIGEIYRVVKQSCPARVVLARGAAIESAVAEAWAGDIVAILGLGALKRQIVDAQGTIEAFNDRAHVEQLLAGGLS